MRTPDYDLMFRAMINAACEMKQTWFYNVLQKDPVQYGDNGTWYIDGEEIFIIGNGCYYALMATKESLDDYFGLVEYIFDYEIDGTEYHESRYCYQDDYSVKQYREFAIKHIDNFIKFEL